MAQFSLAQSYSNVHQDELTEQFRKRLQVNYLNFFFILFTIKILNYNLSIN